MRSESDRNIPLGRLRPANILCRLAFGTAARRTKNRERSGPPQKKRNPVSHPRKNGLGARQMFSRPNRKSHNKKPRIRKSKTPRTSRKTPADNSSPDIRYGATFPLRNARPAPIIIPPRCAEPPSTKHIRRSTSGDRHTPAPTVRATPAELRGPPPRSSLP